MTFRLKIIQVGKFPTSLSLTKLQDFCIHVKLSMSGSNFLLGPSSFDRQNARKISLFVYFPLSLSFSLYLISFLSSPCLLASLPFSFFFFSLPLSTELPLFCLPTPYFLFLSFFSFLSFSHLFLFLFSFVSFLLSFLFLIWIASTEWSKSGGNFPPLSSIAICHHHHFSLNFLNFLFPYFPHLTHGSM